MSSRHGGDARSNAPGVSPAREQPLQAGSIEDIQQAGSHSASDASGEQRFRVVVEAAPNAMVMSDAIGKIVMVNAQAERVFGYPRKELIDQSIEILVPERFRSRHPTLRTRFFAE